MSHLQYLLKVHNYKLNPLKIINKKLIKRKEKKTVKNLETH